MGIRLKASSKHEFGWVLVVENDRVDTLRSTWCEMMFQLRSKHPCWILNSRMKVQ